MNWNVKLREMTIKDLLMVLGVIALVVVIGWKLEFVMRILTIFFKVIQPVLLGVVFAFLLNLPMQFFLKKFPGKKVLSLILALFCVLLTLTIIVLIVSPQIVENIKSLVTRFPTDMESVESLIREVMDYFNISHEVQDTMIQNMNVYVNQAVDYILARLPDALEMVRNFISEITNIFLSLIISIYILLAKNKVLRQCRLLSQALFSKKINDSLRELMDLIYTTFSNFVSGQLLEALIIGVLCYIGCLIFRFPNPSINAVLIGCTNVIPIFGPIIGTAICAMLMVFSSPMQAILFIIFGTLLQQFESHLIYPQVVGNSVGLPPIYVLFAVIICGGMFGLIGMVLGLPIFSVLYELGKRAVHRRIRKKEARAANAEV